MNPNSISLAFVNAAKNYAHNITPYTLDLFWALVTIELLFVAFEITMGAPWEAILNRMLKFVLLSGIYYAVIIHADEWLANLITSFGVIGSNLTGVPNLDPMTVLNTGSQMADTIMGAPTGAGPIASIAIVFTQIFAAGWILVCFALIGAMATYLVIEAWLLIAGGKILLAFGANRWTSSVPEGYISHAIGCGVSLLFMYLLIGIGGQLATNFNAALVSSCVPTTVTVPFVYSYGIPPTSMVTTTCAAPLPVHLLVVLMIDSLILLILCCGLPLTARRLVLSSLGSGLGQMLEGLAIGSTLARMVSKGMPSLGQSAGSSSPAGASAMDSALPGGAMMRPSNPAGPPSAPTQPLNPSGPNAQTRQGYYGATQPMPQGPPAVPTTALNGGSKATTQI